MYFCPSEFAFHTTACPAESGERPRDEKAIRRSPRGSRACMRRATAAWKNAVRSGDGVTAGEAAAAEGVARGRDGSPSPTS